MKIVSVYIPNNNLKVDKSFTYLSDFDVKVFTRVKVNFNNKKVLGFVEEVIDTDKSLDSLEKHYGFRLKFIHEIIDEKAILNKELYDLAKWLSKITISPFISCVNIMLPNLLKTSNKQIKIVKEYYVVYGDNNDYKFNDKQQELFNDFFNGIKYSDFIKKYKNIGKKLLKLNVFKKIEKNKNYDFKLNYNQEKFKVLNNEQMNAYQKFKTTKKIVSLLFGVTGSGKTEVYLHLAKDMINDSKQVLILVPEIGLTPQMIKRVSERFKNICIYHSNLSNQERYFQYNKVLNNEVDIVIGTRSASFLPFKNLGLIIMDEEHDNSYIQESIPAYDTKNIVIKRAYTHNAKVLLASATPSLKVFLRALNLEYEMIKLTKRINNLPLKITTKNNYENIKNGESYIIGNYLKIRIDEELKKNNQIILLLNRRGYTPYSSCDSCFKTLMCKNCDISLNYHKEENIYKCHYCSRIYHLNLKCECGGRFKIFSGYGTEKVEELCNKLFKNIKVARYDYDTTRHKNAHQKIIESFENQEIQILIGTQMIAKGLDFPKVTLVGILDGDAGILKENYRSSEDAFNLLMQASGRSGRSLQQGEVIIQTNNPDHLIFEAVKKQDYEMFFNYEIKYRKILRQPPFINLVSIEIKDKKIEKLLNSQQALLSLIKKYNMEFLNPLILPKLDNFNGSRTLILNTDIKELLTKTRMIVNEYLSLNNLSSITVRINPERI